MSSVYLFPATQIKAKIRSEASILITKYPDKTNHQSIYFLFSDSTIHFPLVFRQAANYPVDLYFIMDVSYTMISYKEALGNFSQKIGEFIIQKGNDHEPLCVFNT